jgi:hypothetical protein
MSVCTTSQDHRGLAQALGQSDWCRPRHGRGPRSGTRRNCGAAERNRATAWTTSPASESVLTSGSANSTAIELCCAANTPTPKNVRGGWGEGSATTSRLLHTGRKSFRGWRPESVAEHAISHRQYPCISTVFGERAGDRPGVPSPGTGRRGPQRLGGSTWRGNCPTAAVRSEEPLDLSRSHSPASTDLDPPQLPRCEQPVDGGAGRLELGSSLLDGE